MQLEGVGRIESDLCINKRITFVQVNITSMRKCCEIKEGVGKTDAIERRKLEITMQLSQRVIRNSQGKVNTQLSMNGGKNDSLMN